MPALLEGYVFVYIVFYFSGAIRRYIEYSKFYRETGKLYLKRALVPGCKHARPDYDAASINKPVF